MMAASALPVWPTILFVVLIKRENIVLYIVRSFSSSTGDHELTEQYLLCWPDSSTGWALLWNHRGDTRAGACFSNVPELFGRISGDIILFVSSKRRCLEARNFAVIFVFIPFATYEKTSFTE